MVWLGYGLAWLSTVISTSVGIYFYTPSCIKISKSKEEGSNKD